MGGETETGFENKGIDFLSKDRRMGFDEFGANIVVAKSTKRGRFELAGNLLEGGYKRGYILRGNVFDLSIHHMRRLRLCHLCKMGKGC